LIGIVNTCGHEAPLRNEVTNHSVLNIVIDLLIGQPFAAIPPV
jgi:hypothetical protein